MPPLFSFSRLRLSSLAPAAAAIATISALLWLLLPNLLVRSVADQLLNEARVLAPNILAQLESQRSSAPCGSTELQAQVTALPAGTPLRVTVIARDGTVLADSARDGDRLAAMENHAGRPEILAAVLQGTGFSVRRSTTTGQEYVYAARRVTTTDGRLFTLRLAMPLKQLAELRTRLAAITLLALAAALAAMMAASLWFDRRLFQPLVNLIGGARRLAAGQYDYRLPLPKNEQLATLAEALNRLAERVRDQIAAVETERDHFYKILSGMSEGVLVVGADGRVDLANPAFRALFNIDREVRGMTPLEVTRLPELTRVAEASLHGEDCPAIEVDLDRPQPRSLLIAGSALGEGGGSVVVVRDTTAANRLAATRRDFVANVSHELRTPLAAIRGYAETLSDGALAEPDHAERFVGRILAHCSRLQALLDDLLTLSRLESSAGTHVAESVDLAAVATRALETISGTARRRKVQIHTDCAEVPPVLGDAGSLERLFVNLLENAVKYNREGGRVDLSIHALGEQVEICVRDTGLGIPAEALPRLFERFYRVDKGRSRAEGGTGLGLAIVKHIAQLHGGTVEVESVEGAFTLFRVRLPS